MAAIGDRMIHKVTDEEFEKTLAPKVRGSLEIFATTQQEEWSLDFFLVLFLGACRAWHNYGQVALQRTATPRPHHLHQFVHVQIHGWRLVWHVVLKHLKLHHGCNDGFSENMTSHGWSQAEAPPWPARTEEALHGAADVAIKTKRIGRFGSLQDAVGPQSNEAKQKSTICSGGTYIREWLSIYS